MSAHRVQATRTVDALQHEHALCAKVIDHAGLVRWLLCGSGGEALVPARKDAAPHLRVCLWPPVTCHATHCWGSVPYLQNAIAAGSCAMDFWLSLLTPPGWLNAHSIPACLPAQSSMLLLYDIVCRSTSWSSMWRRWSSSMRVWWRPWKWSTMSRWACAV